MRDKVKHGSKCDITFFYNTLFHLAFFLHHLCLRATNLGIFPFNPCFAQQVRTMTSSNVQGRAMMAMKGREQNNIYTNIENI